MSWYLGRRSSLWHSQGSVIGQHCFLAKLNYQMGFRFTIIAWQSQNNGEKGQMWTWIKWLWWCGCVAGPKWHVSDCCKNSTYFLLNCSFLTHCSHLSSMDPLHKERSDYIDMFDQPFNTIDALVINPAWVLISSDIHSESSPEIYISICGLSHNSLNWHGHPYLTHELKKFQEVATRCVPRWW